MSMTAEEMAAQLTPQQRVFLFCVATGTDWQMFDNIQAPTIQLSIYRNLVERLPSQQGFVATALGRTVLAALLAAEP